MRTPDAATHHGIVVCCSCGCLLLLLLLLLLLHPGDGRCGRRRRLSAIRLDGKSARV
jgi:hypothetical protein